MIMMKIRMTRTRCVVNVTLTRWYEFLLAPVLVLYWGLNLI